MKNSLPFEKNDIKTLQSVVKNAPETVLMTDFRGVILYTNTAFSAKRSKDTVGTKIFDHIDAQYHNILKQAIKDVFKSDKASKNIYGERIKNNQYWHEITTWPMKYKGKTTAAVFHITDITKTRNAEAKLRIQSNVLKDKNINLENKNIALREVLKQMETEKKQVIDNVVTNYENLMLPILKKIKKKYPDDKYVKLLEETLNNVTSSFGRNIGDVKRNLTPKEIEICNMIKSGLSNKEISGILNLSPHTVEKHRLNIRKKLGIANEKINLTSFLQHS